MSPLLVSSPGDLIAATAESATSKIFAFGVDYFTVNGAALSIGKMEDSVCSVEALEHGA